MWQGQLTQTVGAEDRNAQETTTSLICRGWGNSRLIMGDTLGRLSLVYCVEDLEEINSCYIHSLGILEIE